MLVGSRNDQGWLRGLGAGQHPKGILSSLAGSQVSREEDALAGPRTQPQECVMLIWKGHEGGPAAAVGRADLTGSQSIPESVEGFLPPGNSLQEEGYIFHSLFIL